MTDPPRTRAKRTAHIALSSLEWRAYLAAALAGVYAAVWLASAPSSRASPAQPTNAPTATTVWLDELPATARPPIALPPGWTLASRTAPAPQVARPSNARVRPAPQPSRPVRIRTRSS